jgi:hypothetical protein
MSEHAREVEGVLLVNADDQAAAGDRVAALETVDRFQLRPRPAQRIRDVYIDTDDGALAGSRVAFRLREQDGRPLLTLKADAVRSGLASERLELEAPWSAEALQAALEELRRRGVELPTSFEEAGAGEPLADLAALGLHPTQTRETTRTPRDVVERDDPGAGPVAELTLDDVAYQFPAGRARPRAKAGWRPCSRCWAPWPSGSPTASGPGPTASWPPGGRSSSCWPRAGSRACWTATAGSARPPTTCSPNSSRRIALDGCAGPRANCWLEGNG